MCPTVVATGDCSESFLPSCIPLHLKVRNNVNMTYELTTNHMDKKLHSFKGKQVFVNKRKKSSKNILEKNVQQKVRSSSAKK
jgi:hypothetical protein